MSLPRQWPFRAGDILAESEARELMNQKRRDKTEELLIELDKIIAAKAESIADHDFQIKKSKVAKEQTD